MLKTKLAERGLELPEHFLEAQVREATPRFLEMLENRGGVEQIIRDVDVRKVAKAGQVRALEGSLFTIGRQFKDLIWKIRQCEVGGLVLGDIGAIAIARRKKIGKPGIFYSSKHDLIVLPISDSLAIVGGGSDFAVEEVSVQRLNTTAAKLSAEFFVSQTNLPRDRSLHQVLGHDVTFWERTAEKHRRKLLSGQ